MINLSKRRMMKGLAYGVALGATGMSGLTLSKSSMTDKAGVAGSALPTCDLTIYQLQNGAKETVSLMNLSGQTVMLDEISPVGLEHVNGSLVVRLNNIPNGKVMIKPGERFSFEVEAVSQTQNQAELIVPNVIAGHVRIKSSHTAFNGIIPITVFDSQLA